MFSILEFALIRWVACVSCEVAFVVDSGDCVVPRHFEYCFATTRLWEVFMIWRHFPLDARKLSYDWCVM